MQLPRLNLEPEDILHILLAEWSHTSAIHYVTFVADRKDFASLDLSLSLDVFQNTRKFVIHRMHGLCSYYDDINLQRFS